jgi:hypothetical protein
MPPTKNTIINNIHVYPAIRRAENKKIPNLAPTLSTKNPPINGSIIFGKEYTEYNKLYSVELRFILSFL